jgi:ABC-type multidrug transport system ATPase subunit
MEDFEEIHPLDVQVKNLSVSIKNPQSIVDQLQRKPASYFQVLHSVNFTAKAGQLIAIIGASGSGKTTLLHSLAGRADLRNSNGSIRFDGKDPLPFYSSGACGYVQQHDYLMPYLTVRETLRYQARLRMDTHLTLEQKYKAVEDVILELGLKECADTIIGDHWRKGISGGEKRRVSVGCQLLLNPSILFMDEVTTGLDSFTSYNLIETLKSLAHRGRTIFITIHQPRADIFDLFDSILLLSKGKMVYSGKGGQTMMEYFEKKGYSCPELINPADYVIDITSIDYRDEKTEMECKQRVDQLTSQWKEVVESGAYQQFEFESPERVKQLHAKFTKKEKSLDEIAVDRSEKDLVILKSEYQKRSKPHALQQFLVLTDRTWKNQLRDSLSLWGLLMEVLIVGSVFGAIFFQLDETLPGVLSRRAGLYTVCAIQSYLLLIFVIYKNTIDIKVFDRETADKMYQVIPYVMSQLVAALPFNILFPTIYSAIMYFMMGLRTDSLGIHFFRFALANVMSHFVVVTYSMFSIGIARDFATASLVANSLFTFFSFSTGFFIQLDSIPVYLRWLNHVSFLTYQYRALASNEFSNNSYECADVGVPCRGNDVLVSLGIAREDYRIPFIGLGVNMVGFLIIAILLLQFYKVNGTKHATPVAASKVVVDLKEQTIAEEMDHVRKVTVRLENVGLDLDLKPFFGNATKKSLLQSINAEFQPNALTIIMGVSGSGKSTLLNLLCGRKPHVGIHSKIFQKGRILFNGREETDLSRVASICSFVRQSDEHLLPALTCRETLVYAAKLRLPVHLTDEVKIAKADHVLNLLGLKHCAHTIVGDEQVKGLSGGEKRRLSIGIQLLTDPSVLIVDEPTSGLDAFTAHHIMETLKELAMSGRTVICSIHQPRSDIFSMFDDVLLLARGGRVAYSGPAKSIISYFAQQNLHLPKFCNPADFILDVTSIDLRNEEEEAKTRKQLEALIENWHGAPTHQIQEDPIEIEQVKLRKVIPFHRAFPILTHRSIVNSKRQFHVVIARIFQVLALGIIQALYFARQSNGQVSVQNRIGVLVLLFDVATNHLCLVCRTFELRCSVSC